MRIKSSFSSSSRHFGKMGTTPPRIPPTSLRMSKEGDMVDKPTNLNFMDQEIIKSQPVLEMDGDPYSGVERIPKQGTHIISCVKLHDDQTRVSILFNGYKFFMTVKEQEMN
jgi:hypothetical protein